MLGSTQLVARRAGSHVGVLLTAVLTALAVATLLVSATVLAPGVAEAGFRDTLSDNRAAEQDIVASTALEVETWGRTDTAVRAAAGREPGLVQDVTAAAWTTAFGAPDVDDETRLVVGTLEDPARHAELDEGRWPATGGDSVEVAVHIEALEALGARVGETVTLTALLGGTGNTPAEVVGAFTPADPADDVWRGYGVGVRPGDDSLVKLVGPVLLDRDDLMNRIRPGSTTAAWTISVDVDALNLDNARQRAAGSRSVVDELAAIPTADGSQMSVRGEVGALVDRAVTAATSVRAVLLVVVAMLTVLGLWALAFTARLVAGQRAAATALLRARGLDGPRLLRWSVLGWVFPAAAVAAAAPALAELALGPLRDRDVLADAASRSAMSLAGWLVAGVAASGWLAMLVAADLRAGRSMTGVSAERARPPSRAALQRAGLDVFVVALGLLALQQLGRPAGDTPEIVLVVAPALVLLAGTVLLARGLPWIGRAASSLAVRRRGAAGMLGTFELSRRPLRHAAAASLVVLALAVSVFAATTQSTWSTFRSDAVDVGHPADVEVVADFGDVPAERAGAAVADLERALAALPGVESLMRVERAEFSDDDATVTVLGVDPEVAAPIMRWDERHARGAVTERLSALDSSGDVPVIVTQAFADRLGLAVGDSTTLTVSRASGEPGTGGNIHVDVAGIVDVVPTERTADGVLIDRGILGEALGAPLPSTWWIGTSDDGTAVAEAAGTLDNVVAVSSHAGAAEEARDDASAAGVLAGLAAGLGFATVFVLIGVVVHAVTSHRSRTSEHAVLRAVGLGGRGSAGTVVVEQGLLLTFSAAAGLGLGLVVAWQVVPHTVGGLAGLPEIPPLHLSFPWPVLGLLVAGIAVLLLAVVVVSAAGIRRIDVPAVLRAGEDT